SVRARAVTEIPGIANGVGQAVRRLRREIRHEWCETVVGARRGGSYEHVRAGGAHLEGEVPHHDVTPAVDRPNADRVVADGGEAVLERTAGPVDQSVDGPREGRRRHSGGIRKRVEEVRRARRRGTERRG